MKVYNYINFKHDDKAAEFKRKRKLADSVFDHCKKKGYEYHPCDRTGMIIHLALDNKAGIEFTVVAENKELLPKIKEQYKFMSTEEFLNG